jgi:hypothetical protein
MNNNTSKSLLGKRKRSPDNNGNNNRNTKRRKIKNVNFNNVVNVKLFEPYGMLRKKVIRHSTTRKRNALMTEENHNIYLKRSVAQATVAHEYAKIMNKLDLNNENKMTDIKRVVREIDSAGYNTDMNLLLKSYIYKKYYRMLTPLQQGMFQRYFKHEEERLKRKNNMIYMSFVFAYSIVSIS